MHNRIKKSVEIFSIYFLYNWSSPYRSHYNLLDNLCGTLATQISLNLLKLQQDRSYRFISLKSTPDNYSSYSKHSKADSRVPGSIEIPFQKISSRTDFRFFHPVRENEWLLQCPVLAFIRSFENVRKSFAASLLEHLIVKDHFRPITFHENSSPTSYFSLFHQRHALVFPIVNESRSFFPFLLCYRAIVSRFVLASEVQLPWTVKVGTILLVGRSIHAILY